MSHYIDRNNLIINGTLKIDQANQQDDYVLVSGTAGDATWRPKGDMIPETDYDHYVGELYGGGIVTSVWVENGFEKCLIAAPQDISYTRKVVFDSFGFSTESYNISYEVPWSNVQSTWAGATWSASGASNSNIIMSQAGFDPNIAATPTDSSFPDTDTYLRQGYSGAAKHCDRYTNPDLGTGVYSDWYLPSALELKTLFDNISVINKTLYQYAIDRGLSIDDDDTNLVPAQIGLVRNTDNIDIGLGLLIPEAEYHPGGYWTSNESSASQAVYMVTDSYDTYSIQTGLGTSTLGKGNFLRARPFRTVSQIYNTP